MVTGNGKTSRPSWAPAAVAAASTRAAATKIRCFQRMVTFSCVTPEVDSLSPTAGPRVRARPDPASEYSGPQPVRVRPAPKAGAGGRCLPNGRRNTLELSASARLERGGSNITTPAILALAPGLAVSILRVAKIHRGGPKPLHRERSAESAVWRRSTRGGMGLIRRRLALRDKRKFLDERTSTRTTVPAAGSSGWRPPAQRWAAPRRPTHRGTRTTRGYSSPSTAACRRRPAASPRTSPSRKPEERTAKSCRGQRPRSRPASRATTASPTPRSST